tara:strand:- start:14247 stop:14723 length:477 start_codon:yes stop_codon:yes gene_type:complete
MAGGRPTDYTKDKADKICALLAEGLSLRSVCRDENMPSCQTVFSWMRKHPEFLEQYARAKEESADALTDEILDIADDGTNDWMEKESREGEHVGWQLNGEHVQRSKLRIDSRKWLASKLKPKKYGDRIHNEHSGSVSANLTDDQLDERLKALLDAQSK